MRANLWVRVSLLGVIASTAGAAEIWTDIGGRIAKYDSSNPASITYIGSTGELPMDGMDFTSDGVLYGVADREVFVINQTNGSVQYVGESQTVNNEIYMDISWDPVAHVMYGIGGQSPVHLYQINLNNAAATLVGSLAIDSPWSAGLATTATGIRYIDDSQRDGLHRLNGLNGTFLGPEGFDYSFFGGMTIDWSRDGVLYHTTWNATNSRTELWTTDLTTGVGTFRAVIGQPTVVLLSAAIKPIPEPSALLVLIVLAAGARRR
jgi:hypothetical protein